MGTALPTLRIAAGAVLLTMLFPGASHADVSTFSVARSGSCSTEIDSDGAGNIFFLDYNDNFIKKFTGQGASLGIVGPRQGTSAQLAVANDGSFFTSTEDDQVIAYSPSGQETGRFAVDDLVLAMAAGVAGDLWMYVPDPFTRGAGKVKHYSAGGTLLGELPATFDRFGDRIDIAVDGNGDVYVADASNRIQKFSAGGALLATYGGSGDGPGQFLALDGVTVDSQGAVYGTDSPGREKGLSVQKFSPSGSYVGNAGDPSLYQAAGATAVGEVIYVASCVTVYRLEQTIPVLPQVGVNPPIAATGQEVTINASSAFVPFGTIAKYEYDTGDGAFEERPGATTQVSYGAVGPRTIRVRVTSNRGGSATKSAAVDVRPAPPPGRVGVTVNNEEKFTNDPHVEVSIVWPIGVNSVLVSNDGSFRNPDQRQLTPSFNWTLLSSGPERLPKIVYIRFDEDDKTYTDDIILDETAPTITEAETVGGADAGAAAQRTVIRIEAKDRTSGVGRAQITNKKRKPGKLRKFRRKLSFRGKPEPIFVRVRDRAGNFSRWRKVAD
jgi:hypothetical protein